ncbi:PDZ domain-containing protein [Planctomycetes bacterium K23_9]|uniref:PDZ domain-containing protein n=1 Tax=Stieleria marina TaxID=1930275 RepID=A0A517P350_9BACT|nr:hypothetical protein K239x_58260 [Planctomycetes bacterium K23_9]
MNAKKNEVEKPVLGYVVIAVALLTGLVTANAFGQQDGEIDNVKAPAVSASVSTPSVVSTPAISTPVAGTAVAGSASNVASKRHRRWILGVRSHATQTGCLVEYVQLSSAAQKLGLEIGDRIVAVDGKQVGYIGGRLVSLARTLEQGGSYDGRVRILVQNRRNGRLVSMNANLRSPIAHLGH